jgi:hypothetical protein
MFATPLIIEAYEGRDDFWIVRAPLIWQDDDFGLIHVPPGFITDLASIPRALRNLPAFDPNGKSRKPAVIHDWLYSVGHDKARADEFLRQAMIAEGGTVGDADAFYEAVHLFGQRAWDEGHTTPAAANFASPDDYLAALPFSQVP